MRNTLGVLGIILVAALIIHCTSDSIDSSEPNLAGRWEWVKSVGGNLAYNDPELCNCTQSYVFEAGGDYQLYYNGELQQEGTYLFSAGDLSDGFVEISIQLDENNIQALLSADKLIILPSPLCLACPDSVFYDRQ